MRVQRDILVHLRIVVIVLVDESAADLEKMERKVRVRVMMMTWLFLLTVCFFFFLRRDDWLYPVSTLELRLPPHPGDCSVR